MEQLALEQVTLGKEIETITNKYRNDAPERKTLSYLEDRIQRLNELWNKFRENNDKINAIQPLPEEHMYFKRNYFISVSTGYELISSEMVGLWKHLKSSNGDSSDLTSNVGTSKINNKSNNIEATSRDEVTKGNSSDSMVHDNSSIKLIRKQDALMKALKNIVNGLNINQNQSKSYLELKLKTIKGYWSQIEDQHKLICEQIVDPTIYNYSEQVYFDLENEIQDIIVELLQYLEQLSSNQSMNGFTEQLTRIQEPVTMGQTLMKLPKIILPKFNGNYLSWRQFHDLYTQMVHNQPLSNAQKMWYLKSNLIGEAERLIKHLSITDENYNIAWEILKQRYDNKRLIVTTLIDKLLQQPTITVESASAIKNLHDTTKECLLSLENLGLKIINSWDPFIVHIISKKLDRTTHNLYEQSLKSPREIQTINELLKFLEMRFQSLEALGNKSFNKGGEKQKNFSGVLSNNTKSIGCLNCKEKHAIYQCKEFLNLSPQERQKRASQLELCLNCLKKGHSMTKCPSRACFKCNKKHNTLLHFPTTSSGDKIGNTPERSEQAPNPYTAGTANKEYTESSSYIFLGTAVASVKDREGNDVKCRILLDSGSQLNFITEKLRKKLRLTNVDLPIDISGIGKSKLKLNNRVNITIRSKGSNYSSQLEAYVIKEITAHQPQRHIKIDKWNIPTNITLADPNFNNPHEVDILLGAELYGELMRVGQIKLDKQLPILQNTVLGWIVLGKATTEETENLFCGITNVELDKQLQKLWQMEEYNENPALTIAEKKCEEYFDSTTTRDNFGRFIVSLPILSDTELLKNSESTAFKRLLSIERKLSKDASLKQQYCDFLAEYLKLGHMEEVKREEIKGPSYFLPHHYVLKPDSSTTKLRVVFDASAKTATNLSLNDLMLAGPKVQDDLISIIIRFRMKRYVFTADIKQMYRQIWITEEDRNLQLIMWRNNPSDPVKYYRLCTVTYGTKSAPYLATKCLQRLVEEEGSNYPVGRRAIRDFYVDDVITGTNDLAEAVKMRNEIQSLLETGGFELHKWCANHPDLIKNIPNNKLELQLQFFEKEDSHIKTLGLLWHPVTDHFSISAASKPHHQITKRSILADVAQIYDPLGLINPVVVTSKIFLQDLWKLKYDWDDELPTELQQKWAKFVQEIPKLTSLQVPRHVVGVTEPISTQIHIFCDASEKAYGAVAYVRSKDQNGKIAVRLLCAKSRVAPVKPTTLPRLELCGAKLATNLAKRIMQTIDEKIDEKIFWTDSQIVLSWIREEPANLKTFVANRVSSIQEMSGAHQWRHVPSKSNPADLISRGAFPEQLLTSKLWFNAPDFLYNPKTMWPTNKIETVRITEEEKPTKLALNVTIREEQTHPIYQINHRNSFRTLQKVMAYVLRAARHRKNKGDNSGGFLTTKEIEVATQEIVREVQRTSFAEDIKALKRHNQVPSNSTILSLAPFLDKYGLLRVGGRIGEANISYDAKHPLLLPGDHFVSKLIYNHMHTLHLHAGPQVLNSIVRQKFWILQGRNLARSTVSNCVRCTRIRPRLMNQIMGNLPASRVQQARPFFNCGVDFCGPFYTHFKIRGKRPLKTYIAVFCCFTTKATHLEVVSDLTTEGFIGALKRFIARRGRCQKIFCDNAKNFVGAKNQLNELYSILTNKASMGKIVNMAGTHNIQFKFIPPRAPHFGGLWEAAVKSTKYLLQRSIASAALTYEELCTVTTEIESILNSRPLTAASSDPNDLTPITPAHFLIGESLTATPDPFTVTSKMSLASRWALVNQIREEFWQRWHTEYLHLLQQRAKWAREYPNLLPGTLVLVKEDNQPSLKWPMGRIVETIKGSDGKVRVADVRTPTGIYRRAIHHLAPLITDLADESPQEEQSSYEESIDMRHQGDNNDLVNKEQKASRRKRRNNDTSVATGLKVLLLSSLITPNLSFRVQTPVEIHKINNSAGVYFEKLGNAMMTNSDWKIIVYYDLKPYWAALTTIEQGIQGMKRLANTIKANDYPIEIVKEYQHQLQELKNNNQLLMSRNITMQASRSKRSPFNFIGNALHALVGVLDDNYAAEMSKTINNVRQNEEHLLKLIQNQTSIVEATMNIMKKSEEDKINQMKFLQDTLEKVYEKLKHETSEVKQVRINQDFNTMSILCLALIQDYKNIQHSILNTVTATQHGKISPLILTPDQLKTQLNIIRNNLPPTLKIPCFIDEPNILTIYRLLSVRYHLNLQYAIFIVTIPMVREVIYELYMTHPLPVHINNTLISLDQPSEYILINPHRDQFYRLSALGMVNGIQVQEDLYLIHQKGPMKNKGAQDNCELELFTQLTLPSSCKLKFTRPSKTWVALNHPNQWLFSLDKEYSFTFVCQSGIFQKQLKETGLLIFNDDCTLKDGELSISSSYNKETKLTNYFQPSINLSTLTVLNNITDHLPTMLTMVNYTEHSKLIHKLHEQLDNIKLEQQLSLKELQPHEVHQFIIGYTTIIIIAAVIIYLFITYLKNRPKTLHIISKQEQRKRMNIQTLPEDYSFEVYDFKRGQNVKSEQ